MTCKYTTNTFWKIQVFQYLTILVFCKQNKKNREIVIYCSRYHNIYFTTFVTTSPIFDVVDVRKTLHQFFTLVRKTFHLTFKNYFLNKT